MTRLPLQMTKQCKQTVIVYNKNNHYMHCLDNKMHLCFQIDYFCGATEAVAVCLARAPPVKTVTAKKNELIHNAWRVNSDPPEACCLNVNTELRERRGVFNYILNPPTLIIVMSCLIYRIVWRLFGKVLEQMAALTRKTDLRLTLELVAPRQRCSYHHSIPLNSLNANAGLKFSQINLSNSFLFCNCFF